LIGTMKRRWWVVVLVLAAGVAIAFVLLRAPLVETEAASRREVVQTVVASGRVLPAGRVEVAAVTSGRVVEVPAREGTVVAAGDLLARLDDGAAAADLTRAEAVAAQARARLARVRGPSALTAIEALRRAELELEHARGDLDRLERVARVGAVTPAEVSDARSLVEVRDSTRESARIALGMARGADGREAAADVARTEADVGAARTRLADQHIVAPANGVLIARSVEEGDVVAAGHVLFVLAVEGPVHVRIDPDESSLALLALGQNAIVSPEAYPDLRFEARVSYIASAIDPLRGTIEVRLDVPEPPPELLADMTVSVDVEVARRADALVVAAGVVRDVSSPTPWLLVAEDGVAVRRDVGLGAIGEMWIEVLSGIEEGELAIRSTEADVEAGGRVRLREADRRAD